MPKINFALVSGTPLCRHAPERLGCLVLLAKGPTENAVRAYNESPSKQGANFSVAHLPSQLITVKLAGKKGRGVFARARIPLGAVIERVPVVTFPVQDIFGSSRQTKLASYVFNWGDGMVAIALGYGSLYNHSYRPNANFSREGRSTQVFSALRDIAPGEEITIDYNSQPLSFSVEE